MYRFYRVWKILSCGVLGLLKVSVSAILATVRCSDVYCEIPTWVPRCRCYVSVTVEGCNRYGRDGWFTVCWLCKFGRLVGKGWRRSGGLAWNGLLPFGEYMASSGLLRLTSPRFQNFGLFLTGSSPVRVLLYCYFHFI